MLGITTLDEFEKLRDGVDETNGRSPWISRMLFTYVVFILFSDWKSDLMYVALMVDMYKLQFKSSIWGKFLIGEPLKLHPIFLIDKNLISLVTWIERLNVLLNPINCNDTLTPLIVKLHEPIPLT